jgi:hypothetical protein
MKKNYSFFSSPLCKSVLFSVCALFVQSIGYAQWTTSGNEIVNTNNGRVRINNASTVTDAYTSLRLNGPNYAAGLELGFFGNNNNQGGAWTYNTGNAGGYLVNLNNAPLVLGTSNVGRIFIAGNGNIGTGTTAPLAGLHVSNFHTLNDGTKVAALLGDAYDKWTYFGSTFGGRIRGSSEGYLFIESNPVGSDKNLYLNTNTNGNILMVNGGGNVLIGKASQVNTAYKLDVNGGVRANSVVVNTTGADFVFAKNYRLRPLAEVESFIQANHHLPEIAPAAQMQAEGVSLGELQTQLLQKIEELTLYVIEQKKESDEIKGQLQLMKRENEELKRELNALKK